MRVPTLTCAAALMALPASAQELALGIDLLPGHPVYHEEQHEAGVAMGLSITPDAGRSTHLTELCEELRVAAGLGHRHDDALRLETLFVVPYKGMAVEGFYLPSDGTFGSNALVRGKTVATPMLERILAQAGIPPSILHETDVEHEVSCATGEPLWFVAWHDVRPVGGEDPEVVIERARQRFLAIYQSVLEHNAADRAHQAARKAA